MREVNPKYDRCFYAIHPKIVLLTSQDSVEVLDTRCRPNSSLHPAFTLDDKDFRAIFSVSSKDTISCFSPSSRENVIIFILFFRVDFAKERMTIILWL